MSDSRDVVRVAVVMAGGSGERFWPLSRQDHPKQLLRLTSPTQTMLAQTVSRLDPLIPPEAIYVVTSENLVGPIQEAGVGVPDENVIAEPCKRNTAGCLTFAAAHILAARKADPAQVSMAVVTADHRIEPADRFRETVDAALTVAEEQGVLATHGIVPSRPETGYGYIQAQSGAEPVYSQHGIDVLPVRAFHEKPDRKKAEAFLASGDYFWNSGMFFWRLDVFLRELEGAKPKMAHAARDMMDAIRRNDKGTVTTIFEALENVSIDYALMEHANDVVVTKADYAWDDVGNLTSLYRTRDHDADGNVLQGEPVVVDSKNCIVFNDVGSENMAVSVIGGEDLIVVVTNDAVLVVPKERAQDVREAVAQLKARGAHQL